MVDQVEEPVGEETSYEDMFNQMHTEGDPEPETTPEVPVEEPVPEVVPEPVVEAPVEPEVSEDPYAWIDSLDPKVKEMAESLKHQALSDKGRVSAYHRKVNDLQGRLDATSRQAPPTSPTEVAEVKDYANLSDIDNKDVNTLKEEYPELAGQIDALVLGRLEEQQTRFEETLQPYKEEQAHMKSDKLLTAIDSAASKIFDTDNTGTYWKDEIQTDNFRTWVDYQPRAIQDIVKNSNDIDDTLYVLTQYERDYQNAMGVSAPEAPVEPTDPPATNAADDKLTQRKEKLQASVVSPSGTVNAPAVDSGDYDAMFDAMWAPKK